MASGGLARPTVVIAANVRPGLTGSESTPPWPKIHGFSINTTSWPASGEYTLQPTSPNAINSIRYFTDLPFENQIQVAEGMGRCSKVSIPEMEAKRIVLRTF